MNALSLFNGMSCGYMALESIGIKVNRYYSSEIDRYANKASDALYSDIIQLGDINNWQQWDIDFSSIDLLMAGFPCQAWSTAGKQKGDNDPRGALVHTLIEIWQEVKKHNSNVKFLFENVKMKKEFIDYINGLFGVEPILINSALVSAQNRQRLYWTNLHVEQPEDKGLLIRDIWTGGIDITDRFLKKKKGTLSFKKSRNSIKTLKDKSKCLTTGGQNISNSGATNIKIGCNYLALTPKECMRLQTIPEDKIDTLLNAGISNTQLYKMTGNGWTVDVISHILKGLKK